MDAMARQDVDTLATLCDTSAPWRDEPRAWQWRLLRDVHTLALGEHRRRARWRPHTAHEWADAAWDAAIVPRTVADVCEAAYSAHKLAHPRAVARPPSKARARGNARLNAYVHALTAHG